MSDPLRRFVLPDGEGISRLEKLLGGRFRVQQQPAEPFSRVWLDSFDWRLYLGGIQLIHEKARQGEQLLCFHQDDARVLPAERDYPRWAQDLPAGWVRESAASLLEMRALLPQIVFEGEERRYNLLDREGKTRCRLVLRQGQSRLPGTASSNPVPIQVELAPLKGYDRARDAVMALLEGETWLEPHRLGDLETALLAMGRRPADYSSKLDVAMTGDERADIVATRIHRYLLATMEANLDGTRNDIDSEFLHDFRVAVRRTRSALGQIKGVFPDPEVQRFKEGFGWLGKVTGPTRDLDVYLLAYDDFLQSLPEVVQPDLAPFRAFLERHQKTEQKALRRKLGSPHFHQLMKAWRTFLDGSTDAESPNGALAVKRLADRQIWRMQRRVLRLGNAISDNSPADDLHDLRKECKKLRYLMEFFRELYPADTLKELIKDLKRLLDNLGAFQDLEVQAQRIHQFAEQMAEEDAAPVATLMAMGMLTTGLYERQVAARREFADRFAEFAADHNQYRYRQLFKTKA